MTKIIIGLGNTTQNYRDNDNYLTVLSPVPHQVTGQEVTSFEGARHNVGMACVEAIRKKHGFGEFEYNESLSASIATGEIEGEKVILVRPEGNINWSGAAAYKVLEWLRAHKSLPTTPQDILFIYDELRLPPGEISVTAGRKAASSNHGGIKNIFAQLPTEAPQCRFLRVGIGEQQQGTDIRTHVLGQIGDESTSRFNGDTEKSNVDAAIELIADKIAMKALTEPSRVANDPELQKHNNAVKAAASGVQL